MFDKFESRYMIQTTLTLLSGLHIGGGQLFTVTGSDSPVVKDFNGYPFIPGSSFKGVMRSTLESVLRGIENQYSLWSCSQVSQVSGQGCIELKEESVVTQFP